MDKKYNRQLELFYWNEELGDMDLWVTDVSLDELDDIQAIDICVSYPEGEEIALVTYKNGDAEILTKNKNGIGLFHYCYVLYNNRYHRNWIDKFLNRESPFDM